MAFKMRNSGGTFKTMGSSPNKANASNAVWSKANEASKTQNDGVSLNDLVAKRKTLEKGSNDYNINQNAINKAMGNSKRYDVEETKAKAPVVDSTPKVTETRKDGSTKSDSVTSIDPNRDDGATMETNTEYRKNDKGKRSDVVTRNESTYDAKTGEGSSGMGNTSQKTKYKLDGVTARKRQVSTGDMGTDDISDDAKRVTKTGNRKTKVKIKSPGVGTSKTKTFTKGKRAGTTKTKVRAKGQLFGRDPSKAKTVTKTNRSTWDPATGTGSSGLGMETLTTKGNKQKTEYSMGTDSKKDDKVTKSKVGKRKQTSKTTNANLEGGGTGTSKTKHYTKGKKAGTSVTKERKKGQLFGRKVNVNYGD